MALNQFNMGLLAKHAKLMMHEYNERKFITDYPRLAKSFLLAMDEARIEELERSVVYLEDVKRKLESVIKEIKANMLENSSRR